MTTEFEGDPVTLRADPASIAALSDGLEQSAQSGGTPSVPTVDVGPSTAAVQASLAEVLRAETGLTETLGQTAGDLNANKTTYATTEAGNEDLFRQLGR